MFRDDIKIRQILYLYNVKITLLTPSASIFIDGFPSDLIGEIPYFYHEFIIFTRQYLGTPILLCRPLDILEKLVFSI